MSDAKQRTSCQVCGTTKTLKKASGYVVCSSCRTAIGIIKNHPEKIKTLWPHFHEEPILPEPVQIAQRAMVEMPDVIDGKRYQTIDRERNKWYLLVSEVDGRPVEVFASTAFDRNHELQSRISNLTTITRLISLILRHIFLHEPLTMDKCLKQIQRSSRQKNDLPDMLFGILSRYRQKSSA